MYIYFTAACNTAPLCNYQKQPRSSALLDYTHTSEKKQHTNVLVLSCALSQEDMSLPFTLRSPDVFLKKKKKSQVSQSLFVW